MSENEVDFKEVELVSCALIAGAEANGRHARELDGRRLVILQFKHKRLGDALSHPLGLLLEDAQFLADNLPKAIAAERAKETP